MWLQRNLIAILVADLLVLTFFTGFLNRAYGHFEEVTLLVFGIHAAFALFIHYFYFKRNFGTAELTILGCLILAFLFSFYMQTTHKFILQLGIFAAYLAPLLFLRYLSRQQSELLLHIIVFICCIQIFFDLVFPFYKAGATNLYAGSFFMSNYKSRYLGFVLLFVFFKRYKLFKVDLLNIVLKSCVIILIAVSIYLGKSFLVYVLMFISLIFSFFVRKLMLFLLINGAIAVGLFIAFSNIPLIIEQASLFHAEHGAIYRVMDIEHGAMAVYKYGIDKLVEFKGLGVGLGNFSTRAAQFFPGEIMENVPQTFASYRKGIINVKNVAPSGVASLFIMVVEMGILAIPILYLALTRLWSIRARNFYGYMSFYYLFYLFCYRPMFFETHESFIYLAAFYLTNKHFEKREESKLQ